MASTIDTEAVYANCPDSCPDKLQQDRADPTLGDFADCAICAKQYHLNCLGFPAGSSERIKKFVCSTCKDADNQTIWMALEPNRRKLNEKAKEYFEITSIVSHRIHRAYREFKVRWKGYSARSDSWLRERSRRCHRHALGLLRGAWSRALHY